MKRKLIALAMSLLILPLSACGGSGNSGNSTPQDNTPASNNTSASNENADTTAGEGISFPLAEKQTLTMLTNSSILAPGDPNDKLIWQRYEEETNVHIDWLNYTSDVFAEKRNLLMATSDLPDALFIADFSDHELLTYAKNGAILPIEDLVDGYMPRLKAIYDEYPEYRHGVTATDGHIYSIPWIEELGEGKKSIHTVANIPWINTALLSELGLAMPTTTEEFTDALRAFKEAGYIPMSYMFKEKDNPKINGESANFLFGAFGYGDNGDFYVIDDGKVIFTLADEGYKEAVKWFSQLYSEGLIDTEVFTQDWSTYVAKGKAQKYGVFFTWDMGNVSGFVSGDYADPDNIVSDYAPMPQLTGPTGIKNVARWNGRGYGRGKAVITADTKNAELVAAWFDRCYDPLQSPQNNWGTYGDTTQGNIFELDGTLLKHLPLGDESPVEIREKTSVGGPLAILDKNYDKYVTIPDDAAWRLSILEEVYVPDMYADDYFPGPFYSLEDVTELVNIEKPLREFALQQQAEWIKNGNVDAEWEGYLAELERRNLPRYLEILQKYYDADNQ